ncbi:hypothetical protein BDZ91DRAFT_216878 [Kalaharituber pfeilii]|nr:hypothetical protein BDZ91DRAFT_216878 [Kalaharituber pfeilii]
MRWGNCDFVQTNLNYLYGFLFVSFSFFLYTFCLLFLFSPPYRYRSYSALDRSCTILSFFLCFGLARYGNPRQE